MGGVFRGRHVEEDIRERWRCGDIMQGSERSRRCVGGGRDDRVCTGQSARSEFPASLIGWWRSGASYEDVPARTLATLAATLARWQENPLYGRRQPRRCQRRQYRRSDLSKWAADCRSARRLSRAVSTERSPGLHPARNAVCGPIRSRSRRSQGRSDGRRPGHQLEYGDRRDPLCHLVQRHTGLSTWAQTPAAKSRSPGWIGQERQRP